MTQEALSGIIDLSPSHYSHIESGKARINLPTMVAIAQALDTTIDSLLYDSTPVLIDSYDKVMHITGSYSAEGYYTEFLDWSKMTPMDITLTGTFGGADSDENFFTTPE